MDYKFDTRYLVCFDCSDDVNYVLARTENIGKARRIAKIAKRRNPDSEIYITVEKMCIDDAIGEDLDGICKCGKLSGCCIGDLSCRCNQYDVCKETDTRHNPMDPYEDPSSSFGRSDYEEEDEEEDEEADEELAIDRN